jgi:hypothetical protein
MEKNDLNYQKLVKLLRKNTPELENPGELANRVIMDINTSAASGFFSSETYYRIFGWTLIPWMRTSLSAGMVLLIGILIFQSVELNRKLSRLEDRFVSPAYNYYQSPYSSVRSLTKLPLTESFPENDSIRVSTRDLKNLLDEYLKLEKQSREIPGSVPESNNSGRHFEKGGDNLKPKQKNSQI